MHAQLGEYVSKMEEKSQRERNHNFNLHLNFMIFTEKLFKNRKFWLLPSQVVTVLDMLNRMVTLEHLRMGIGFKQFLIFLVYKMRGWNEKTPLVFQ